MGCLIVSPRGFPTLVNPVVRALLGSPLHALLSGSLMLLTYTGRKTGRRRTIPVMYASGNGSIVVLVGEPERKQWWRNLRGGAAVTVRIGAETLDGHGEAVAADPETLAAELGTYLAKFPRAARAIGAAETVVIVRIRLARAAPLRAGEPPVYRSFALLAFAAALTAGVPLGVWMLTRLYWGGGPIPAEWLLLHAHLQLFGFFGTLILGVAPHLVARFTSRSLEQGPVVPGLLGSVGAALALRVAATAAGWREGLVMAALLHAGVFGLFGVRIWRSLASPPLALTRTQLTFGTGWLVLALLLEAGLRWGAPGADGPDPRGMRAVHLMGLFGGITGWVLGVALRAAPMFVPRWRVPEGLARAVPWCLALGVLVAVTGERADLDPARGAAIAKLGEALALGTVAAVALTGGALRAARGALPMLGMSAPETWLFRLAMLSAGAAAIGSAAAAGLAWTGFPLGLLSDALRHLATVGFLTAMVVAMAFRLIPVFEGTPVPWPRLRSVAFWALLAGVLIRSSEVLADYGWDGVLPWLPVSGLLVWLALACLAVTLIGAIAPRWGRGAPPLPGS